jgi:hypothetical protein
MHAPRQHGVEHVVSNDGARAVVHRRLDQARADDVDANALRRELRRCRCRQTDLAVFRRHIGRPAGETEKRIHRTDIDDRPAIAGGQHRSCFMLHAQEASAQIGVDGDVPSVIRNFRDRRNDAFGAGIVDGDVKAAMGLHGVGDHALHVFGPRDVCADVARRSALRLYVSRQRGDLVLPSCGKDHRSAALNKEFRRGPADAAAGASDDGDLSFKNPHFHFLSVFLNDVSSCVDAGERTGGPFLLAEMRDDAAKDHESSFASLRMT